MPDSANIIWQTQTENILKPNNISNHHHFMTIHPFLHDLALSAISVFMLHAAQQYKTFIVSIIALPLQEHFPGFNLFTGGHSHYRET